MKPKYPGLAPRSSRRSILKGTAVGATGLAAAGGVVGAAVLLSEKNQAGTASAHGTSSSSSHTSSPDSIQTILNIAITAETLAVVFYTNGLLNARRLGFSPVALLDIEAALVEEQVHLLFLAQNGAKPLTTHFSFPYGYETFERLDKFIAVQQLLEAAFIAAYLAAGKEFAMLGRPDLVQVAAQIGGVEAEHRAIGRAIGGLKPANNRAFEAALLQKVSDAPGALQKLGFLRPASGNSYDYKQYSSSMDGMVNMRPSDLSWS